MKKIFLATIVLLTALCGRAWAENVTVNGDMGSHIRFAIDKQVTTVPGVQKLVMSFVVPETFTSPTYRQKVEGFDLKFTPQPETRDTSVDARGNRIVRATWKSPPRTVDAHLSFDAVMATRLAAINTTAPYPMEEVPKDARYYLRATPQVQADDRRIKEMANELVRGVGTEYGAVQRILTFVVDYVHYVSPPAKLDAVYSLSTGKGNCQNYSHLSAALMRAAGIPVRIVNGITLDRPLHIAREQGMTTFRMGQGRHSWIEVWFPDLGWVPFDPQQTILFVPNRFLRFEVGIDNDETVNDGMLRWSSSLISMGEPSARETIRADFVNDSVNLKGKREPYGPRNFLLSPTVSAQRGSLAAATPRTDATPRVEAKSRVEPTPRTEVKPRTEPTPRAETKPPVPEKPADTGEKKVGFFAELRQFFQNLAGKSAGSPALPDFFSRLREKARITFKAEQGEAFETPTLPEEGPAVFGNLEFPADIDFAFPPVPAVAVGEGSYEKARSFFVETAEYVTSGRTQYAQVFTLAKPMKIERVGLALHKFGGEGQLWIDLCRDGGGKPAEVIATSELVDVALLGEKPGYRWADFPFSGNPITLPPGNYWIALGFTGNPVVNWFFTYGKPVGPGDGTRYKSIFDTDWSNALAYEFTYRVAGIVVK